MPFVVTYDALDRMIEIARSAGVVTTVDMDKAFRSFCELQRQTGALRILVDGSDIRFVTDFKPVMTTPGKFAGIGLPQEVRFALVDSLLNNRHLAPKLFVEACREQGWEAQRFKDRAKAVEWLKSVA